MAQHDYIISNATFPAVRTDINNALSAIQTNNSGTSRPTGAVAGQIWLDTTNATSPTLKFYDGADDISLATINYTANTVDWLDSSITITGLSTTATGTVLTLSDTANTTTQNLIIDNQKEIRFRETTANGTNYVALKAPASVASDLTFTLPATDGVSGQALVTNGSGVLSFASAGISWQSVQTSGFTASAGKGYPCNTTSSAFTVTLPATPSVGDTIILVDYAGTFATNNITLGANSNKIEGAVANKKLTTNREAVTITYVDSTQGWVSTSGSNEGTTSLEGIPYSVDVLVVAGGGGSPSSAHVGGGGGAGGFRTATLSLTTGSSYTITVGAGGSGASGSNSSISGSGITTLTSAGGGRGGDSGNGNGLAGGSGGGAAGGGFNDGTGGAGNTPSTSPSQGNSGGDDNRSAPNYGAGGGGGASAVGANGTSTAGGAGGNGTASSITGSSVTYAGGGGGGTYIGGTKGTGGTGGGGTGSDYNTTQATAGTANTGGGAGGSWLADISGGSGVVILRMLTTNYSGTTTGSPTVTTDGSYKVVKFTGDGTYTA